MVSTAAALVGAVLLAAPVAGIIAEASAAAAVAAEYGLEIVPIIGPTAEAIMGAAVKIIVAGVANAIAFLFELCHWLWY